MSIGGRPTLPFHVPFATDDRSLDLGTVFAGLTAVILIRILGVLRVEVGVSVDWRDRAGERKVPSDGYAHPRTDGRRQSPGRT